MFYIHESPSNSVGVLIFTNTFIRIKYNAEYIVLTDIINRDTKRKKWEDACNNKIFLGTPRQVMKRTIVCVTK